MLESFDVGESKPKNPLSTVYTLPSQTWHSLSQLIVGKLWTKWRILFPALVVFDLAYRGWVGSALWTLVLLPAHARCEFRARLAFLFLSGTPCGTENTLLRNCNLKRPVHNVWRTFCPCYNRKYYTLTCDWYIRWTLSRCWWSRSPIMMIQN